jgi:hypothetical protein
LVQGEEGAEALACKIAAEKHLFEAGHSIIEGIDRMFKMYWCFNIDYQPVTSMFWQFMQAVYGLKYGTLPKGVIELKSILNKYVD